MTDENMPKRIIYFDYLRIFSILIVLLLHTFSVWETTYGKIPLSAWLPVNFFNAALRFGVPVFIMVSGAINLNPEKTFSLKKRLLGLLIPSILWSLVYIFWNHYQTGKSIPAQTIEMFKHPIFFHLWFVYVLVGLYLVTPLVRPLVTNKKLTIHILIAWMVVSCAIPLLGKFADFAFLINLNFLDGYLGLYIFGYFLHTHIGSRMKTPKLILGYLITVIFTFYGLWVCTQQVGTFIPIFLADLAPNVILMAIFIFLIFKNIFKSSSKEKTVIKHLNNLILHLYLGHALILSVIDTHFLNTRLAVFGNPLYYSIFLFLATLTLSFPLAIASFWISKIMEKIAQSLFSGRHLLIYSSAIIIVTIFISGNYYYTGLAFKTSSFLFPKINKQEINVNKKPFLGQIKMTSARIRIINIENYPLRVTMPVHVLATHNRPFNCAFYIPDETVTQANTAYIPFGKVADTLFILGASREDLWGHLICKHIDTLDLEVTSLSEMTVATIK